MQKPQKQAWQKCVKVECEFGLARQGHSSPLLQKKKNNKNNLFSPRHRGLGGKYSRLVFTWMRKVVGSNLGDDLYIDRFLSFFCGNRLKKGDCYETVTRLLRCRTAGLLETTTMGDEARRRRSHSNQPSSRGSGAIYRNIVIYKWWKMMKIKALARWPEKEDSRYGGPT